MVVEIKHLQKMTTLIAISKTIEDCELINNLNSFDIYQINCKESI